MYLLAGAFAGRSRPIAGQVWQPAEIHESGVHTRDGVERDPGVRKCEETPNLPTTDSDPQLPVGPAALVEMEVSDAVPVQCCSDLGDWWLTRDAA